MERENVPTLRRASSPSPPLKSKGQFEDVVEVEEGQVPIAADPISAVAPSVVRTAFPKASHVECSALEVESDDEVEGTRDLDVLESSALPKHPHETLALSLQHSPFSSSGSSSSSSSDDSNEGHGREGNTRNGDSNNEGDSSDGDGSTSEKSCGFFVSKEDPATVAEELNASSARLVGGHARGAIRLASSKKEHSMLAEAGDSFCLLIMEKELMQFGAPLVL